MIESLVAVLSSSGMGAITGGFFGWLNRREDRKTRRSDQEFELSRITAQSSADTQAADARAFEESQKTMSAVGGAIKSAVRPVITGCLLYMVYVIMIQLESITGGLSSFSPEESASIYREIVLSIVNLAAVAVSWWFASRPANRSK